MIRVQFKDDKSYYDVNFSRIDEHTVELQGDIPQNETGFSIFRKNYSLLGDYPTYTYLRQVKNGYIFSDIPFL